jgi:hypothetical protein
MSARGEAVADGEARDGERLHVKNRWWWIGTGDPARRQVKSLIETKCLTQIGPSQNLLTELHGAPLTPLRFADAFVSDDPYMY